MAENRIAILGAGRIGEALLTGLLSSGWRTQEQLVVTARSESRVEELRSRHGVEATTSNADAVAGAEIVVHTHVHMDGAQVASSVNRHNAKAGRRTAAQTSGRR